MSLGQQGSVASALSQGSLSLTLEYRPRNPLAEM